MLNQFQQRPQSRSYRSQLPHLRPITRQNDTQQSQKCFVIGKQHQSRNQLQKAQKFYIQATIHNPLHYKAYCNLGLCYKIKGRYGQSIGAYLKSISINPNDDISHYNLGNVYRLIGNYEKSIEHYLRVIQNNKKLSSNKNLQSQVCLDSYNNLGVCYKMIENYHKAVQCFQYLLKIKTQDQQVLFNLAVCKLKIVRKMIKDNQQQNYALLVKEIIQQTKIIFMKVIQKDKQNQVAKIALIELNCLENLKNQPLLQSTVVQLDKIIQNTTSSTYMIDQALKLKAYCLSLLKKYQQSAQQYQKAMQKQKLQEQNLRKQKQNLIKQKQRQIKINHDKQIQKIRRQQQSKLQNQVKNKQILQKQKVVQLKKLLSEESINQYKSQKSLPQQSIIKVEPISLVSVFTQQEFQKIWNQVQSLLMKQININDEDDRQKVQEIIDNVINKQDRLKTVTKQINERVRKQLEILSNCLVAQKLNEFKYYSYAFDIYLGGILNNNIQTPIDRQTLYLSAHRAIANTLTTLGYNQKAIQHYQILSHEIQTMKQKKNLTPIKQQLHSGLAVNYQSQGYYSKAIQQFNNAIKTNPQNYTLYYNLAYCQHCENMNSMAIENYNKFLSMLQKDTKILGQQKLSYTLQAKISIFLCETEIDKKIDLSIEIMNRLQTITGQNNISLSHYIDDETLLKFYLPACDMFQQIIYVNNSNQKQQEQQIKKTYKQKLFKLYISLLNIKDCPDREQILINCGNLLFQQRQYLNALTFYQKVYNNKGQQKVDVGNMIGVTMLFLNQFQKALQYLTYVNEQQPQNTVYRLNLQMMKWAFGIECDTLINQLCIKYPCQCDSQFNNRVELIKSYILKLTNYLQQSAHIQKDKNTGLNNQNIQQFTLQKLFKILFSKDNKCWKSKQIQNKHYLLQKLVQKHCAQTNHNTISQAINVTDVIKQLTILIQTPIQSFQNLKQIYLQLKQKLSQSLLKRHPNYLHLLQQILSYFIYYHTTIVKQNQQLINKLFSQLYQLQSTNPIQQIIFPTQVIENSLSYPSKSFAVLYPKIQLKLQNLIQSLSNWQLKLQDQFTYLIKIIQSLAYKNGIDQALTIQFNFPHCKNVQNCQQCLQKAVNVFKEMFRKDKKIYIGQIQIPSITLQGRKKSLVKNFISSFVSQVQPFLSKSQHNPQQSILTFSLSQKNLPITLLLHFPSQNQFKKFLNELCKQLSVPEIKYQSTQQSLTIILNKLISFKCEWKQHDFIEQFLENLKCSKLSIKQTAVLWLSDEKIKE